MNGDHSFALMLNLAEGRVALAQTLGRDTEIDECCGGLEVKNAPGKK